jgi:nitrogenase-associated protein
MGLTFVEHSRAPRLPISVFDRRASAASSIREGDFDLAAILGKTRLAAPRVKSGEVVPAEYDEASALALLLAEPLLIRRPLLEVDGKRYCGFDPKQVGAWIGLNDSGNKSEPCPICNRSEPCPPPEDIAP